MVIGKESATPLYEQICVYVREAIQSGKYKPGDLLPSEADFQKYFSVSRITVRRALKLLCDEGVLRSVQGKGTYVNELYEKDWSLMRSFSNDVIAQGHIPSTKMLHFRKIKATKQVAGMLEVEEGTEVYALKRMRYIDSVPFWVTTSYILASAAPGLTAEYFSVKGSAQSIFFVLRTDFSIEFNRYKEVTAPENIDPKDMELLQSDYVTLSTKASLYRDTNNKPIVYEHTVLISNEQN